MSNGRSDPSTLILTSLASGSKHGYALQQDIAEFSGVALGPGTLYGAITRLEQRGLIVRVSASARRQPYRLTAEGAKVLAATLAELSSIVDAGTARLSRLPRCGLETPA